ncbi:hypothetical protein Acr_23g0009540 [Actinidia rufa]|uniref:HAT dimerization domain-containing protein n=1 Tax=Actinidia rufa TaxID=165716 RepID=A0A7J0GP50_9ERIC|nr:hypothetical protein Acr_23g0009540 [Actinidia rufa]
MDLKESIHSEGEGPEEDKIERPTATPLWRYVTKVIGETNKSKGGGPGGGSGKFICNFGCQTKLFIGSYSRVSAHMIGLEPGERAKSINLCPMLSEQERGMLKKEEMDARRIFGGNAKVPSKSYWVPDIKGVIEDMFHIGHREDVDQKIARRGASALDQHDTVQKTVLDDDFWKKAKRVLKITKPIYRMLRFCDTDKAVIGEVYEQMDTTLGNINVILKDDQATYDLIHKLVVERWDKMNIPLHCLAYVLVPKYYTNSWLSVPAPRGVKRRKPHFDMEVQKGYLEAIDRMILDPSEATLIRHQNSDFVSSKGVFAQPQAVNDRATTNTLSWWHMYDGATLELLLSRHREDYESFKSWDMYDEDANIEEDVMTMEGRENVVLSESEDDIGQAITNTPTPPVAIVSDAPWTPPYSTSSAAATPIKSTSKCPKISEIPSSKAT